MSNTLKRAAELLRGSGKRLAALTSVPAIMAHKTELDSIAAELDLMAQVEPVAAQSKHHDDPSWRTCGIRHHLFVQENKSEWPGYDTRLLYAGPQEPVNQQLLAALREMVQAYKWALASGREIIVDLGGDCDTVDIMHSENPSIRKAMEAIAAAEATK